MLDIFLYLITAILTVSATILPIALAFGITMPFLGVLVRYRANYAPKRGVRLTDGEDWEITRSETESYFGMMRRVHRLEGWAGLYKGIILLAVKHMVLPNGRIALPTQSGIVLWLISFTLSLVPVILLIPMQIITNRAITTPTNLTRLASRQRSSLAFPSRTRATRAAVLHPRSRVSYYQHSLQFVPGLYLSHRLPLLVAALPVIALATAMLTPLQVMGTRLTLQRLDATPERGEVMEFRTQQAPYTSLFNCGKQMMEEEGVRVCSAPGGSPVIHPPVRQRGYDAVRPYGSKMESRENSCRGAVMAISPQKSNSNFFKTGNRSPSSN
ncbi:hypothetical protein B0H13DRAFT_2410685 [Mycena leptocephala]|nr:hypothetical protein B0H13DRAFT_2410685 [Mycena leptocephala]